MAAAPPLLNAVHKLFKDGLKETVDEEVVSYIAGSIANQIDAEDVDLDDLRDIVCGFSETFSELSTEAQDVHVLELVHEGQRSSIIIAEPPAATASLKQSITSSMAQDLNHEQEPIHQNTNSLLEDPSAVETSLDAQEIDILASMCPSLVPEGFLRNLLYIKCKGCLPSAADALLTSAEEGQLETEIDAWNATLPNSSFCSSINLNSSNAAGSSSSSAGGFTASIIKSDHSPQLEVDEELRRSIVAKYHLQSVPSEGGGSVGGRRGSILAAWGAQGGAAGQGGGRPAAVRYRDGVVVSNKGEKFIVEKPPEWDGGSRGKVKSKRKGGKGWQ